MTYITLSNDMRLMVTKSTPIYRGDNLNQCLVFLLPVQIDNMNLETATVFLSYIRSDGEPDMVILNQLPEKYNVNYYQYAVPVTCKLSRYPGQICMWLQICDGNSCKTQIAKSSECTLRIHESKSLDNCFHDHQLTALYQLKKKYDEMAEDFEEDCTWEDMEKTTTDGTEWEDMIPPQIDLGDYWEDM